MFYIQLVQAGTDENGNTRSQFMIYEKQKQTTTIFKVVKTRQRSTQEVAEDFNLQNFIKLPELRITEEEYKMNEKMNYYDTEMNKTSLQQDIKNEDEKRKKKKKEAVNDGEQVRII